MDKNSLPAQTVLWKSRLALTCLLGMIGGLLCSRALASISMMMFGLVALWGIHPKEWLKQRWWLFGLCWISLYAISYFWSADKELWRDHMQVKLPFLLLPLAFGLLPHFLEKDLRVYTWGLAAIMLAGAAWSTSFLWRSDASAIIDSYKYAHVLRTPVYNDHIAFSTAVAASIAWIVYSLPMFKQRLQKLVLGTMCMVLAIYLHILAAKTGLLAFYVFALGYIVWQVLHSFRRGLFTLVFVALAACLAFLAFPTLQERVGYSLVTWRSLKMGERTGNYSDAGRIFSYDIALRAITEHPMIGVGAGDVLGEMRGGYSRWYPQVPAAQQLWPHNQFLTCAMAAGIPAAMLFIVWLLAPLRLIKRNRKCVFFLIVWLMLLVPLMVDPFLEVQFGVAVFLIFLLMQRETLLGAEQVAVTHDQLHPNIPA